MQRCGWAGTCRVVAHERQRERRAVFTQRWRVRRRRTVGVAERAGATAPGAACSPAAVQSLTTVGSTGATGTTGAAQIASPLPNPSPSPARATETAGKPCPHSLTTSQPTNTNSSRTTPHRPTIAIPFVADTDP